MCPHYTITGFIHFQKLETIQIVIGLNDTLFQRILLVNIISHKDEILFILYEHSVDILFQEDEHLFFLQ